MRLRQELLVALFFVAATLVLTWPLLPNLTTAVSDPGDPYVSLSILDWNFYATTHDPARLFHLPVFYPARYALAFTEHLYGIALTIFPLLAAGVPLIAAYNVALILGFAFSGYGAYVLGRLVTGRLPAALIGGLFFAFLPYRFTQVSHLSYVWSGWLPLLLAALLFYDRGPGWKRAWIFGAVFFLNGVTCMTWLAFGSIITALTFLVLVAFTKSPRLLYAARIGTTTAVAIVLLLPFLWPYREVSRIYGMTRRPDELEIFSARWSDWLVPGLHIRYSGLVNDGSVNPERWLFPGLVASFLAILGIFRLRAIDLLIVVFGVWSYLEIASVIPQGVPFGPIQLFRGNLIVPMALLVLVLIRLVTAWRQKAAVGVLPKPLGIAILWIVAGLLGSFGLHSFFHSFLFESIPPLRSIRVPSRWGMIAFVGLSVLVTAGVESLVRERGRLARRLVVMAVGAALLLELSPAPIRWYLTLPEAPAVYSWLKKLPLRGAVLELPLAHQQSEYGYLLRLPVHRKPMVNGASSFIPPHFGSLAEMSHATTISDSFLEKLEELRCSLIIVHLDELGPYARSTGDWLRAGVRAGRLVFLRHFAHEFRGDYVFAVTATEPDGAALRRFPGSASLQPTWAALEEPSWDADVRGPLEFRGGAISPQGVRAVRLLFNNGRVVVPIHVQPSPAVRFRAGFSDRPLWARHEMDVQVAVSGADGSLVRSEPVLFRWRERADIAWYEWEQEELAALLDRLDYDDNLAARRRPQHSVDTKEIVEVLIRGSRSASDSEFVRKSYRVLFDREPDPTEVQTQTRRLQTESRRDIARSLVRSDEFARRYVRRRWAG